MRRGWTETGGIHEQYLVLILRLNAQPGNRKCGCPQQKNISKTRFFEHFNEILFYVPFEYCAVHNQVKSVSFTPRKSSHFFWSGAVLILEERGELDAVDVEHDQGEAEDEGAVEQANEAKVPNSAENGEKDEDRAHFSRPLHEQGTQEVVDGAHHQDAPEKEESAISPAPGRKR